MSQKYEIIILENTDVIIAPQAVVMESSKNLDPVNGFGLGHFYRAQTLPLTKD